ncbi:MAG: hemerythrin domain-containing protein [Acidobacteria bacterium]|nr:hemerythrin domain-containing protein [Acidobacteriota bacterium]
MENEGKNRRDFLKFGAVGVGAALLVSACGNNQTANSQINTAPGNTDKPADKKTPDAKEVTAVEDLMREHGILRRALLVYSEAALRLRKNPASVAPEALRKTAELFRSFGEDYHEKKLEEAFLFPLIKQKAAAGAAAKYVDVLVVQHNKGREITDYILSVTNAAKIGANAPAFADLLAGFARMYEHHAAREDTIIFPAWKELLSSAEYDELNDKFEDIEHAQFGEDGFEDAVRQIGEIEASLNLSDISQFTAAPPPAAK